MWTLSCGTKRVFATDLIFWNVVKSHWLFVEEALVMLTSWLAYKIHCTALQMFPFSFTVQSGKKEDLPESSALTTCSSSQQEAHSPISIKQPCCLIHVSWRDSNICLKEHGCHNVLFICFYSRTCVAFLKSAVWYCAMCVTVLILVHGDSWSERSFSSLW